MDPHRLTLVAAAVVAVGGLAACNGSGGDQAQPAGPATTASPAPVVPDLPETVPLVGPITEPAMQPVWLVRSTGTAESQEYDVQDQGVFVDGDVVVYFALDTILGVARTDGSAIWKTPVDMGGEIVEYAATRAFGEHRFSFVYPQVHGKDLDAWGEHLVTVDTQTGEIVRDENLGTFGTVTAMANVGDELYLATEEGLSTVGDDGTLYPTVAMKEITRLRDPAIRQMTPVDGADVLSVEIDGGTTYSVDEVAGIGLDEDGPETVLWSHPASDFERNRFRAGYLYLSRGDGRYVTERDWDRDHNTILHLWTLDPETGDLRAEQVITSTGQSENYHRPFITENDVDSGSPHALTQVGDDVVFVDGGAISRYNPVTGQWVWTTREETMGLRNGNTDYAMFHLGPVSADGSMIFASYSEGPSGDLLALDLETGRILARWALDDRQQAGLVNAPLMAVDGLDVVLARNRTAEGNPDLMDSHQRLGPPNDLGLLRFPEIED